MSTLAKRLKELREEKGYSLREFARALNVDDRTVRRWEKDERVPNTEAVILAAKLFNVTSDYLLGLSEY